MISLWFKLKQTRINIFLQEEFIYCHYDTENILLKQERDQKLVIVIYN